MLIVEGFKIKGEEFLESYPTSTDEKIRDLFGWRQYTSKDKHLIQYDENTVQFFYRMTAKAGVNVKAIDKFLSRQARVIVFNKALSDKNTLDNIPLLADFERNHKNNYTVQLLEMQGINYVCVDSPQVTVNELKALKHDFDGLVKRLKKKFGG